MCGIVAYVGSKQAVPLLIDGLGRLEYSGYDSAGVAVITAENGLDVVKEVGKLADLIGNPELGRLAGDQGIGHTRWATHGRPSVANSHPHVDAAGVVRLRRP